MRWFPRGRGSWPWRVTLHHRTARLPAAARQGGQVMPWWRRQGASRDRVICYGQGLVAVLRSAGGYS
jgi:hypothetical protein